MRLLFGAFEASSAVQAAQLSHAGGGARSDVWCQIRADVLGRPIECAANLDAGLVGAAALVGLGRGAFATPSEVAGRMVRAERTFEPNPARTALHDEGFARYLDLTARFEDLAPEGVERQRFADAPRGGDHAKRGGGRDGSDEGAPETVAAARKLRRALSPPEAMLWSRLRTRRGRWECRRFGPIGPYVLDFFCSKPRLAIRDRRDDSRPRKPAAARRSLAMHGFGRRA